MDVQQQGDEERHGTTRVERHPAGGDAVNLPEFHSWLYEGEAGQLRATDGRLYALGDVIRVVMLAKSLPLWPAVSETIERLSNDPGARCYITHLVDWATPLPHATAPAAPAPPPTKKKPLHPAPAPWRQQLVAMGRRPALQWLLKHLQHNATRPEDLYSVFQPYGESAHFAVHVDDVVRLFSAEWLAVFGGDDDEQAKSWAQPLVPASDPLPPVPANHAPGVPRDRRFDAVDKLRGMAEVKGARAKVAAAFGVDSRTVGKWLAWVEKHEAHERAEGARQRQVMGLVAKA